MTYVAPAAKILTELHIPEDPAELAAACLEPVTVCGLAMDESELWRPVERAEGDRVCAECAGVAVAEPGLW